MFRGTPILWRYQQQPIVSLSITEAEYLFGCDLVKDLLPIKRLLIELGRIEESPLPVLIDNLNTIRIAQNESGQLKTNYIDV